MQGILKSKHQKLCECLQDVKEMEPFADGKLRELDAELQAVFLSYQEKMQELKRLIHMYEERERSIRNEIKRIRKNNIVELKKNIKFSLHKATA